MIDWKTTRIYVAGHRGMVGSAVVRALLERGCPAKNIIGAASRELDLRRQAETEEFIAGARPDLVIVAAAHVGGIHANATYPAEFLYDNLVIGSNVVHAAHLADVPRLLFLGSSCIYPKLAPQPIPETALLAGPLEPTNEAYAIAKIASLKLCEFYRKQYGRHYHAAMPCNLYGAGDNYHPENSHVIPALIRRFHEARGTGKPVSVWGTGEPRREFLHADDLAEACLHLCEIDSPPDLVNIGSGHDITIGELAALVSRIVGFEGEISFDTSRPDGTPRKLMDSSVITHLGWKPKIGIEAGLKQSYQDFLQQTQ